MAAKSPDQRGRIPTVSELLDNPSLRALAERWNRSAVIAGVRSFLDELRNDLSRRGAEKAWPPLREMAERAAQRIVAGQQSAERAAVNATGRIWGSPWVSRPQSDAALEQSFAMAREFIVGPARSDESTSTEAESLICRLTGAEAAVVVHSYAGALWLAVAALAHGKRALVARGELAEIEPSCAVAALARSAGAELNEVGSVHRTTVGNYESAVTETTAAILRIEPEQFQILGDTETARLEELVALARDRELVLIDALGISALAGTSPDCGLTRGSVRESLGTGVHVTVVRGDGLVGGPPCGILAGQREYIRAIVDNPLFAAWRLDPVRSAALAATLEAQLDGSTAPSPIVECLTVPVENLKNRAERLAPQLATAEGIKSAEAVPLESACEGIAIGERKLPSYGVALVPTNGNVAELERRLASMERPVIGRVENDRVVLDLRTVLPRHDQWIVRKLGRGRSEPSEQTWAHAETRT